ncbi:MAG: hypothetical protein WDM96_08405 [Lacunisphaera sp.]
MPIPIATRYWMHGLHIDARDNVWVTDVGRHLAMKFSPEGTLLTTLGTDEVAGGDATHFNQPTQVCVTPAGDIYVTDGYGNSRVVRFNARGEFVAAWGSRGTKPGQFHTPHMITRDAGGRLYVSDRENDRIQVFDESGAVLDVWEGLHSLDGCMPGRTDSSTPRAASTTRCSGSTARVACWTFGRNLVSSAIRTPLPSVAMAACSLPKPVTAGR